MPFMSMRVLGAVQVHEKIIHTAIDDLESFFWLLIWGIVYATKDIDGAKHANKGIQCMLDAWSGGAITNKGKLAAIQDDWTDAVFGNLIREWLVICRKADEANRDFALDMSFMELNTPDWDSICNGLEAYCKDIYREVLELGFRHLRAVKEYHDWKSVVAANILNLQSRRRRY